MPDVVLPQLGETISEATISIWLKSVGDHVEAGEPIAEVSTDKVDTEIVAPTSGRLTEIRIPTGESATVGDVIAVLGGNAGTETETETETEEEAPTKLPSSNAVPEATTAGAPVIVAVASSDNEPRGSHEVDTDSDSGALLLSPVVRRLVEEAALDPNGIKGSGAGGRIQPSDVRPAALSEPEPMIGDPRAGASTPEAPGTALSIPARRSEATAAFLRAAPPTSTEDADTHARREPLSRIRLATGRHMIGSLAMAPHALSVVEIDYSNVERFRSALRDEWRTAERFSLTSLPFVTRAIVDALVAFPHLNATVDADSLVVHRSIHMGIAVDLDHQGLVVPVIRDADTKRLRALSREINDLAVRARSRTLPPEALSGGTFTITNNGSAGSVMSSAIINQPQVAIVSTDRMVRRPVAITLPDGAESIAIRPIGLLTMSWDHRAFDGAYAAAFLVEVKRLLESKDWSAEV